MNAAFFLPIEVPSKKNGKLITGKRLITDPAVQKQLAVVTMLARGQWRDRPPLTEAKVEMTFHVSHKRRDLDNVMTSVLDCLVDAGVLKNDNMTNLEEVSACFLVVRPGAEGVQIDIRGEVAK